MKKYVMAIIIFAVAIFLTGCGSNSVKSLIEKAEILDWKEAHSIVLQNAAKAEDYEGKHYIYTGEVGTIEEDYCYISDDGYTNQIEAHLDKETLKTLNRGDIITIVGKLEDLSSAFRKFDKAVLLDAETINEYLVVEVIETTGVQDLKYSNYVYDKELKKITSYKTSGDTNATYNLTYDKKENLIKEEKVYTNTSYGTDVTEYVYNSDNTIKTKTYTEIDNGVAEVKQIFEYTYEKNSSGQVLKMTTVNTKADNYTQTYEYTYENNQVTEEIQTSPNSKYKITYKYDDNGNVVQKISENLLKTSAAKTQTTYTYGIIAKK